MRRVAWFSMIAGSLLLWMPSATQAGDPSADLAAQVFPGAERIAPETGDLPARRAYIDGKLAGYILSTAKVVGSTGYGGGAIDVAVGVTTDGRITGARLLTHNEPILVIGISPNDLDRFVDGFVGLDIRGPLTQRDRGAPDAIAGATVSSAVIQDAIVHAARNVLRAQGPETNGSVLKRRLFQPATWNDLLAQGAIQSKRLTFADVPQKSASGGNKNALFIELYTALLTPPRIGGNLLGEREHQRLMSSIGADDNVILVAANGSYSFKGRTVFRTGVFDRIQIVQSASTFRLRRDAYANVERLKAEGAPELREIARFVLPAATGFDPAKPWRVDLFVDEEGAGGVNSRAVHSFEYTLPAEFVNLPATEAGAEGTTGPPLWRTRWETRSWTIAGLLVLLGTLSLLLVFQDQLVRKCRFRDIGRLAFLTIVLVWLGWIAGGQLSVLQVVTFAHAFLTGFHWEHFLVDPVTFILWGFVAVTLMLWGRGVYCGWLCPFGALQELVNAGARRLGVPQVQIPFAVHERLWAIKYVIFIGLFAVSLHSIREVITVAEVEPFKTAISLKFQRDWPFVLYVAGLLGAGVFIERFFCRYLCPLGAALALPARLRTFNWLKRRHQCGSECQICSERCTVQAIHPTGEINPNECIHCLECQTYYFDDHICPPLVAKRKRRERRLALSTPTTGPGEGPIDA